MPADIDDLTEAYEDVADAINDTTEEPSAPRRRIRAKEPELRAMEDCHDILADMDEDERGRVVGWLAAKFNLGELFLAKQIERD